PHGPGKRPRERGKVALAGRRRDALDEFLTVSEKALWGHLRQRDVTNAGTPPAQMPGVRGVMGRVPIAIAGLEKRLAQLGNRRAPAFGALGVFPLPGLGPGHVALPAGVAQGRTRQRALWGALAPDADFVDGGAIEVCTFADAGFNAHPREWGPWYTGHSRAPSVSG